LNLAVLKAWLGVKKKYRVVCLVSPCFYLFSNRRAGRKDLSWAMSHAREPPRNKRLLPLKESVQAHKNPGDSFMLTSNPIHAGHEVMIESVSIEVKQISSQHRPINIVYLPKTPGTDFGLPKAVINLLEVWNVNEKSPDNKCN
jgi:hypothetical protein